MLIQYDLYNQVTEVSIESLVAFLFYSKEHAVIDTLWDLRHELSGLCDDAVTRTLITINRVDPSAKAGRTHLV